MTLRKITQQDIEALLEVFDRSSWRELHVKSEDVDLFASKNSEGRRAESRVGSASTPAAVLPDRFSGAPGPASAEDSQRPPSVPAHWIAVRAPTLGTFYRAPKPGAPPFASVGQRVTADTEICIIEVMKLFTTVRAGLPGTICALPVSDGELVEFDQPLCYIERDE
jgi:acetyl-CoA carboxylase biotin carboxyl carrier protein